MVGSLVQKLGKWTIDHGLFYSEAAEILREAASSALRFDFINRAVFTVLIRQIYFTSVQAIPVIFTSALILGSITVNYLLSILTGFGAYNQVGNFLLGTMLHEIAPVITIIILLLRSGTAVISEIALMKINGEIDALRLMDVSIPKYIFLPRILAFLIAGPSLAIFFSVTGLIGSFFILGYIHDITFDNYLDQLFYAIEIRDVAIVVLKPALMAVAVAGISIQNGMCVRRAFTEVPVMLIRGMMQSVIVIALIEAIFTFAKL